MTNSDTKETAPELVDTSLRWNATPGPLYSETTGYGDEEIRSYPGRRIFGVTVGILQLAAQLPMPPGDMGNASTFPFPVLYESTGPIEFGWLAGTDPHPEVVKRSIAAAKRLELQGVRAIIGNCGFWANYQQIVAEAINVPFFSSSLLQIPMVMTAIRPDQKVGVMTAHGEALKAAPALKYSGVTDMSRIVIYGAEHDPDMLCVLNNETHYNPKNLESALVALARKMVEEHPDIGAVVLECSEFPPHAHAVHEAIRLNVWDFTTLANWMFAGTIRKPFTGWM